MHALRDVACVKLSKSDQGSGLYKMLPAIERKRARCATSLGLADCYMAYIENKAIKHTRRHKRRKHSIPFLGRRSRLSGQSPIVALAAVEVTIASSLYLAMQAANSPGPALIRSGFWFDPRVVVEQVMGVLSNSVWSDAALLCAALLGGTFIWVLLATQCRSRGTYC
ncbi:hypothetical protein VOLCADRAFT_90882 [Volvox carteri f. nagariensis]|uniref:Uncharacterized protein n=1 Tax=Volvox carteri f. nagariensis TaxID=3068 RepID=D8TVB3_VOLCA|nr:uncharacterized protein VOLCADRAFT_90882 [Volvox carteri f. nagariensis]EFJ48547.1 hypothetical protein VOLCADRAFT_90882 [Volvox carteri f. nagariensis]|eukprot:XP_002950346.1 hypothetical protein VOLCADRAFT_90882 [Volvox carteri f. nagariensis]